MAKPRKMSSDRLASLAGRVLQGYQPTPAETRQLAASVLSQDEVRKQVKVALAQIQKAAEIVA